jgi:hypothetical protein
MKRLVLAVSLLLAGCGSGDPAPALEVPPSAPPAPPEVTPPEAQPPAGVDLSEATPVRLWATRYFAAVLPQSPGGVPLRSTHGKVLGPRLSREDWCTAAMEGTVIVDGVVYNWAGVMEPPQTNCAHDPSELVRFMKVDAPYGLGVESRHLQPFRSLACDIGRAGGSTPWLNGGFAKVGQEIFIPAAVGTILPDGSSHDGIFVCEDMGEMITGNHIDVFVGPVQGGDPEAAKVDPFSFIHSSPSQQFDAYVLPMR